MADICLSCCLFQCEDCADRDLGCCCGRIVPEIEDDRGCPDCASDIDAGEDHLPGCVSAEFHPGLAPTEETSSEARRG